MSKYAILVRECRSPARVGPIYCACRTLLEGFGSQQAGARSRFASLVYRGGHRTGLTVSRLDMAVGVFHGIEGRLGGRDTGRHGADVPQRHPAVYGALGRLSIMGQDQGKLEIAGPVLSVVPLSDTVFVQFGHLGQESEVAGWN